MGERTAAVDDMSGLGFCGNGGVVCCFRHSIVVVGEKEYGAISRCGRDGGVGLSGKERESPPRCPGV